MKPLQIGNLTASIPVIQGGMGVGISLSSLAGAVAGCGGIGIISTAQIGFNRPGFDEDPIGTNLIAIAEEVAKAKEISNGGIVGVNIMVATRDYESYVKAAVAAGVDIIISGAGLPMDLPRIAAGSDVKLAPIVSGVKSAQVICKYWMKKYNRLPDCIVIEGPKAGGHLGFSYDDIAAYQSKEGDAPSYDDEIKKILEYVRALEAEKNTKIAVVVAGGIYDRQDAEHALALGADGVQMATRFVTTYECDAPLCYKEAYINAREEDIVIVKSPVGMPGRAIRNAFVDKAKQGQIPHGKCHLCVSTCKPAETPYCITDALVNAAKGNLDEALLFCGSNACRSDHLEHVSDIMKEFLN